MSDIILFDFLPIKTLFLIMHLFGVIMAFGAALMTDAMFFTSIRKKILTTTDLNFIKLASSVVWIGLGIIFLSGALLFSLNPEGYLQSGKFLAKITIVVILFVNGLAFHFIHLPVLWRNRDTYLPASRDFISRSYFLFISGAVSSTSWMTVFILGMIKTYPFSYGVTMAAYGLILIIAAIFALLARMIILNNKSESNTTATDDSIDSAR